MITASASSPTLSGRFEKISQVRALMASRRYSGAISRNIRSYVSSSVLGNDDRALLTALGLKHFLTDSSWQVAQRNLFKIDELRKVCHRIDRTYIP
jgi:hypothetical protein